MVSYAKTEDNLRYLLLRGIRLLREDGKAGRLCDLLIGQNPDGSGTILRIGRDLPVEDAQSGRWSILSGKGQIALPAFIDSCAQFGSPEFFYREDPQSADRAALSGGFSTLLLFPQISLSDAATLQTLRRNFESTKTEILPAVSICHRGKRSDISVLRAAGAKLFTDEGADLLSDTERLHAMRQIEKEGGILFIQTSGSLDRGINDGRVARLTGLRGSAGVLEQIAVAKALLLSADSGCPIHIPLISDRTSVSMIRAAKKQGIPVTCGTSPLYTAFTEEDLIYRGAAAKVDPPLRTEKDRLAIIEGLADGSIDCLCSGHAPLSPYEKQGDLKSARSGASGLETAFAAGLRFLVEPGYLTLADLSRKLSENPGRLCGKSGRIEEGAPADLLLCDPDAEEILTPALLSGKAKNSPFLGMALRGRIEALFLGGIPLSPHTAKERI